MSSKLKQHIQPIMDGHVPTMVNIQWGSIVLLQMSPQNGPNYYCKKAPQVGKDLQAITSDCPFRLLGTVGAIRPHKN
jgi:hypothetical protein